MKSKIAILFIWVFSFGNFFAQEKKIDSLKQALKKISAQPALSEEDTTETFLLNVLIELLPDGEWEKHNEDLLTKALSKSTIAKNKIAKNTFKRFYASALTNKGFGLMNERNTSLALESYTLALKIHREINNKKGQTAVLTNIASLYKTSGDVEKALEYNKEALKVEEEINDIETMAKTLNNIALIYSNQGNTALALDYLFRSLTLREKIKDTVGTANVYLNLGLIYIAQDEKEKALQYYLRSFAIRKNKSDKNGMAGVLSNIGHLYAKYNQFDSALHYYDQSLLLRRQSNDKKGLIQTLNGIGSLYSRKNELDKALSYFEESLVLCLETNNKQNLTTIYSNLGTIYYRQEKIEKAEGYAKTALKNSQELGYPENIFLSADLLYNIYKKQNKFQDALQMHELSTKMQDSVSNLAARKMIIQKQFQYEYEKKSAADSLRIAEEKKVTAAQLKQEKTQRYALYGGLSLLALFASFMFNRFRVTNRQKQIIEIKEQETQHQKKVVEEKNKEITDSITYAKRIQQAILPPQDFVNEFLPENFILYKPKDLVAGDFYWMEVVDDNIFIAAADSTGHGVPGALVSVVCSNALNRAVKEFNLSDTGKILDKTRELVLDTFAKSSEQVKDGMDISLLCIDKKNKQAFWSGANNPLWRISSNNLSEIKADKQPIGKTDQPKPFTTHALQISSGDVFYLFTDGFADQFGGEKGKKFKYQQLKDLLLSINNTALNKQEAALSKAFDDWKGKLEQVDDVCIIGIRI